MEKNRSITKEEAEKLYGVFSEFLIRYKEKPAEESDTIWLQKQFGYALPEVSEKEHAERAGEIVASIQDFDNNYRSVNEAAEKAISKEKWFEEKVKESAKGLSQVQYGELLNGINESLHNTNIELEKALTVSTDGMVPYENRPIVSVAGDQRGVNMNPNLDGVMAEELIAKTTQIDANMLNKNVSVDVLKSTNANSVDVRIRNNVTGEYQNYQLKFGKNAQATIDMIEKGNYNNQRIIVPKDQLEEVQAHFKAKGSNKTITDHIEAYGVKGKSYTKEELKELQKEIQEKGNIPELGYNDMQTSTIIKSIGANAGALALQSAAITTGWEIVHDLATGKEIKGDELVENALQTGADTGVKVIAAGALEVGVRKGLIKFIPKGTPAGMIANIACVGVENAKILSEIGEGKISVTQGLDKMGRTTFSMGAGLLSAGKGAAIGAAWGKAIGAAVGTAIAPGAGTGVGMAIGTGLGGLVGGMVSYAAGSKFGEVVYKGVKKFAPVAQKGAKVAMEGAKKAFNAVKGVMEVGKTIGKAIVGGFKKLFA